MLKKSITIGDLIRIAINLVPLVGVWFYSWNPREVFMVYCMESILIGLFTLFKLGILSFVKKRDVWNNSSEKETTMPGLFFMFFFFIHYGFFIAIQLTIFLSVSGIQNSYGISNTFEFITHFSRYLSYTSKWLLLGFIISYSLLMIKEFIIDGTYKIASMNVTMFEPYGRIFIQQFTVIAGSFFLGFGAGKIFMIIFVGIKIYIEVWVNFERIIAGIAKKQKLIKPRQ